MHLYKLSKNLSNISVRMQCLLKVPVVCVGLGLGPRRLPNVVGDAAAGSPLDGTAGAAMPQAKYDNSPSR